MSPDLLRHAIELWQQGVEVVCIANRLGLHPNWVLRNLRRAGHARSRWRPLCPDRETLERLRVQERLSIQAIARRLKTRPDTVRKWLARHAIPPVQCIPEPRPPRTPRPAHLVKRPDRDTFMRLYVEERRSYREIAEACGASRATVLDWVKHYDPPRRKPQRRRGPVTLGDPRGANDT